MNSKEPLGLSFADTTELDRKKQHTLPVDVASLPAAGVSGSKSAKQSTLTLSNSPSSTVSNRTETRAQYKPPPAGLRRQEPLKPPASQLPKPDYPLQFQSVTHADYKPDALQQMGPRSKPAKLGDSGSPLAPVLDKPEYGTQTAAVFKAHSREACQAANQRSAGFPATHIVKYDIIHGAPVQNLNPHDAWTPGYDYKRKQ